MTKVWLTKTILAGSLVTFGLLGRWLFQDWPNIETITAAALMAGALLGWRWGVAVSLIVIATSDILIGNNSIIIFTWSAFALIGISGGLLRQRASFSPKFVFQMTGWGLGVAVFFFLFTNFGVWLLFPLYPPTGAGLIDCYLAAIPFFQYSLASTLITVPLATIGFTYLQKILSAKLSAVVPKSPSRKFSS